MGIEINAKLTLKETPEQTAERIVKMLFNSGFEARVKAPDRWVYELYREGEKISVHVRPNDGRVLEVRREQ